MWKQTSEDTSIKLRSHKTTQVPTRKHNNLHTNKRSSLHRIMLLILHLLLVPKPTSLILSLRCYPLADTLLVVDCACACVGFWSGLGNWCCGSGSGGECCWYPFDWYGCECVSCCGLDYCEFCGGGWDCCCCVWYETGRRFVDGDGLRSVTCSARNL